MMGEFHFLRPLWLLALPPMLMAGWWGLKRLRLENPWRKVVDDHLLKHLTDGFSGEARRGPLILLLAGWSLAVLALAGPTWERAPAVKFRPDVSPMVIVLDLSRSMDAVDVRPSRLSAARVEIGTFLERLPPREVGLVVFSGRPHTVMPLTEDRKLIRSLLPYLHTGLMPAKGSAPAMALQHAFELIERTGRRGGDILLVTDGGQGAALAADAARRLGKAGTRISVLGVGTAEGGHIPTQGNAVLTHDGIPVRPRLDRNVLQTVADAGSGSFALAGPGESDVTTLLPPERLMGLGGETAEKDMGKTPESVVWRDRGHWLVILLLPFAALAFRRGWLSAVVLALALQASPAQAFDWRSLWLNADQRGLEALEQGEAGTAAQLFSDPFWKGVALYRDKDYEAAISQFGTLDTAAAHYNRGNALAYLERNEEAIRAWEAALERDPGFSAARTNIKTVRDAQAARAEQSRTGPELLPPTPGHRPPPTDGKEAIKPFAQEFLAEKGGDRLLRDMEGDVEKHGVDAGLGGGQILGEGSKDTKGKEEAGLGQASRRARGEESAPSGAQRPGQMFGGVAPGGGKTVTESGASDYLDYDPPPMTAKKPDAPDREPESGLEGEATYDDPRDIARKPSQTRPADVPPESGKDEGEAAIAKSQGADVTSQGDARDPASGGRTGRPEQEGRDTAVSGGQAGQGQQKLVEQESRSAPSGSPQPLDDEARQAFEQWLARIPDDPGGLLREKFRREAERGRIVVPGGRPW